MRAIKIPISKGWPRERLPLLLASMMVMGASMLGFIAVCRALVRHFYACPPWAVDGVAGLLGVCLLAGCGDLHYELYPYDYLQAFVFSLGLLGILRRAWWAFPIFLAAAYSKETSFLLVVAQIAVTWAPGSWRRWRWWLPPALMTAAFVVVRLYIGARYPGRETFAFWWPTRNVLWLRDTALLLSWLLPFFLVGVVRFVRMMGRVPVELGRLMLLVPLLVGAAFFKGWIEEFRQYGELLPIVGLAVAQWLSEEMSLAHLFVPHPASPASS
jgi:hypothetical protein